MIRRRALSVLSLLALPFAFIAAACGPAPEAQTPSAEPRSAPVAEAGEPLPDILKGAVVPLPEASERVEVPGFDGAGPWLNVDRPLSLEDLSGRVVIVDFWTSCCINCLQTLPVLDKVEERFKGLPLVVVGIHSPKFDEEADAERLIDIVLDNRIAHPVASDAKMKVWRAWGVEAWPTVAVLDTNGKALWAGAGEPDLEELTSVVRSVMLEARERGELKKGDFERLRPEKETAGVLRYPGKVKALGGGGMAITDTGHHRVVVVDKEGKVELVAGSGEAGKNDGAIAQATFNRPQGVTEIGDDLFVADTGNHAIRKINRRDKTVTTVAGTGELGGRFRSNAPHPALQMALRSPWALEAVGDMIFVALAGSHQIGLFLPKTGQIRLFAGSGLEARRDGEALSAAFAQPSDLAFDKDRRELFVLDSETSSIRAIDVQKATVRTVVGKDLFVFGDVDGDRETARLQHPIGLATAGGVLYVADTYNSKVKEVDPKTGVVKTLFGGRDDKIIDEPAGLTVTGRDLVVADTNHHRILLVPKLGTGSPEPITLRGVDEALGTTK